MNSDSAPSMEHEKPEPEIPLSYSQDNPTDQKKNLMKRLEEINKRIPVEIMCELMIGFEDWLQSRGVKLEAPKELHPGKVPILIPTRWLSSSLAHGNHPNQGLQEVESGLQPVNVSDHQYVNTFFNVELAVKKAIPDGYMEVLAKRFQPAVMKAFGDVEIEELVKEPNMGTGYPHFPEHVMLIDGKLLGQEDSHPGIQEMYDFGIKTGWTVNALERMKKIKVYCSSLVKDSIPENVYTFWATSWAFQGGMACALGNPVENLLQFTSTDKGTVEKLVSFEGACSRFSTVTIWTGTYFLNSFYNAILACHTPVSVPSNSMLALTMFTYISALKDATSGFSVESGPVKIPAFWFVTGGAIVSNVLLGLVAMGIRFFTKRFSQN